MSFHWTNLISLNSSQNDAFEELVCQLANKESIKNKKQYIKVGNPDGGVECYIVLDNGDEVGFQAKWFLSTPQENQWSQIEKSFKTTLEKHPKITTYYIAIPLDRADPRIDNQEWFMDKWNEKVEKWKKFAQDEYHRDVELVYWGSSELITRLTREENLGLKSFFFGDIDLSNEWFKNQNELAIKDLGARYTHKLNISNDNEYWDFINGNEIDVKEKLRLELEEIFIKFKTTFDLLGMFDNNSYELLKPKVNILINYFYKNIYNLNSKFDFNKFEEILEDIQEIIMGNSLISIISSSDSQTPADKFQDTIYEFFDLLRDKTRLYLYNESFVILTGEAGIGKSHLLADIIEKRLKEGLYSIFLLGQHFRQDKNPWSQILDDLLRLKCGESEFLGALNARAEAQNKRIIIFIDAINEGQGRNFWNEFLVSFMETIKRYEWLGLVLSVRSSYVNFIVPTNVWANNLAVKITHDGFKGLEYDASKQFFEYYQIIQPSTPLLYPEFSNPLFLKLFCEGLSKNNLHKIPEGYVSITNIMKFFLEGIEFKLQKKYPTIGSLKLIDKVINTLIREMINTQMIAYDKAFEIVEEVVSKFRLESGLLDDLISEGLLAKNMLYLDEKFIEGIYFAYERFEDHLKVKYLFDNFLDKKNVKESFFKEDSPLNKYCSNGAKYRGMIDEMSIQLSETYMNELFEIYPKNKIIEKSFIESLAWRKIESITSRIVQIVIDKFDNGDRDLQQNMFETLLVLSFSPKHPLNILSIHQKLLDMSMLQRDYEWSLPIHNLFIEEKIVKRIINWAWDKKEEFEIENESLYLYGLTLGWFLTSSNRELRDGATKALVNLFTDKVDIFLGVLQLFETVNDLYVLERLYTVSYGIVLQSNNRNGFRELGKYIYRTIFDSDIVVEHILLRDYAKLTIEYIESIINLGIEMNKVLPPYDSSMPSSYPTLEEIEKYKEIKEYGYSLSNIIRSMRTESLGFYGDFGRYTFQSALAYFEENDSFDIQLLSNYVVKVIKDEYISDLALFSKTENLLHTGPTSRYGHKVERIGKKYQWLAMYKVLAMVADNYKVRESSSWEKNYIEYSGVSELGVRDIDPTTILKEKNKLDNLWWLNINNDFENPTLDNNEEWLQSADKLPLISELVNVEQKDFQFLILDLFLTKNGNKELDYYRHLRYTVSSYIVKKDEFKDTLTWVKKQNFYKGKISEPTSFYSNVHLREYPNSQAYRKIDIDYYGQLDWDNRSDDMGLLPHKILLTATSYLKERGTYDASLVDNISINLPNKWFINEMELKQSLIDGEWINEKNEVVFFDPTIKSCCSHGFGDSGILMANKELLLNWLDDNGYKILWILSGEKNIRNTDKDKFDDTKFIGYGGVSGYAYFDGDEFIENIDINVERPLG